MNSPAMSRGQNASSVAGDHALYVNSAQAQMAGQNPYRGLRTCELYF